MCFVPFFLFLWPLARLDSDLSLTTLKWSCRQDVVWSNQPISSWFYTDILFTKDWSYVSPFGKYSCILYTNLSCQSVFQSRCHFFKWWIFHCRTRCSASLFVSWILLLHTFTQSCLGWDVTYSRHVWPRPHWRCPWRDANGSHAFPRASRVLPPFELR